MWSGYDFHKDSEWGPDKISVDIAFACPPPAKKKPKEQLFFLI